MFIGGTRKPKVKEIYILGIKYTDPEGDTYHKSLVYVNDKYLGLSRKTYGSGKQFIKTAMDLLVDKGYFPTILKEVGGNTRFLYAKLKQKGVKFQIEDKELPKRQFQNFK